MKNLILIFLSLFLLSSCVDGFRDYFKRSANNKLIDTEGFKGKKRKPLYNKKYVTLAKRNILEDNLEDDDDYDDMEEYYQVNNPALTNRQMYMEMLREDALKRKKRARLKNHFYEDNFEEENYPSLAKISKLSVKKDKSEEEIQKELTEIKALLSEAKHELAKARCPANKETIKEVPLAYEEDKQITVKKIAPTVQNKPSSTLSIKPDVKPVQKKTPVKKVTQAKKVTPAKAKKTKAPIKAKQKPKSKVKAPHKPKFMKESKGADDDIW